jgi:hypothetical protein
VTPKRRWLDRPGDSYGYDADGNLTDVYGVGTTRAPTFKDDDHARYTYGRWLRRYQAAIAAGVDPVALVGPIN